MKVFVALVLCTCMGVFAGVLMPVKFDIGSILDGASVPVPGGYVGLVPSPSPPPLISDLMALPDDQLEKVSIAELNFACAYDLPGSYSISFDQLNAKLSEWTRHVDSETQRQMPQFFKNPEKYGSESYFKVLALTTIMTQDFGLQYDPEKISTAKAGTAFGVEDDVFFDDSADVFIHGFMTEPRYGTCSSFPVLAVAVGRRLGYPMRLAATEGHFFARWEAGKDSFNIEWGGNNGLNCHPDEHYLRWPIPITKERADEQGYLRAMTAREVLSSFLSIRGAVFEASGDVERARVAYSQALVLTPKRKAPLAFLSNLVLGRRNMNPVSADEQRRKAWARAQDEANRNIQRTLDAMRARQRDPLRNPKIRGQ